MVGASDLTMYLIAIKSLLYYIRNITVVVHSDGSLGEPEFARLRRHVEDIRIIRHGDADAHAAAALVQFPLLAEWRARDAAYRRLIDVELWRSADRIIILDADVLTNREPIEVAQWIGSGTRPFLLGQVPRAIVETPPRAEPAHVQAQFSRKIDELATRLGTSNRFLQGATAGFCGYFNELSLAHVERALKAALDIGLPMWQWGGDQCLVIYLLSTQGAERLPSDRYVNFEPSIRSRAADASMIHFYGTHRFHGLVYPRLAAAASRRLSEAAPISGAS